MMVMIVKIDVIPDLSDSYRELLGIINGETQRVNRFN